jgi:hypothetical protein
VNPSTSGDGGVTASSCGWSRPLTRRCGLVPSRLAQPDSAVQGSGPVQVGGVDRQPERAVLAVQLTRVRCPVRVSERPGVQCPASGVRCGVRCPCLQRPLRPTGLVVERGQRGRGAGSRAAGMAGQRGGPPCPQRRVVGPRLDHGARGWHRPCWASGGSASTWSSSWAVVEQWPHPPHGRPGEAGCVRSLVGRQLAATTLRGQCGRLRAESPGL